MVSSVDNDDDLVVLAVPETATRLGVSEFTLLRMRRRPGCDGLPFVQISPGRIGYLKSDVREYLASRRVIVGPVRPAVGPVDQFLTGFEHGRGDAGPTYDAS